VSKGIFFILAESHLYYQPNGNALGFSIQNAYLRPVRVT